jgi:hypothetical protein
MSFGGKLSRYAGVIVLVGAILGIVISLLLNAAYSATSSGAELSVPPWQSGVERVAGSALTFASADDVYHAYGRVLFVVLAAFIIGLYGLYAKQRTAFDYKPRRSLVWGYRLAMTGLVLALIGNVGDYWLGLGTVLDLIFFVGGTILGLLLVLIGLVLFAVGGLRGASLPRPVAWSFILWFPVAIVLAVLGMENLPSVLVLPLSLAWVVVGMFMVLSEWTVEGSFEEAGILEKV